MRGTHASVVEDEEEFGEPKIPENGIARCECACGFEDWDVYRGPKAREGVENRLREKHRRAGCFLTLLFRYEHAANGSRSSRSQ